MKFVLNGCDILLIADAPEDMTLKELLVMCDRIKPDWCACGICTMEAAGFSQNCEVDVFITKTDVIAAPGANCTIRGDCER